jgi:hypothetical protein
MGQPASSPPDRRGADGEPRRARINPYRSQARKSDRRIRITFRGGREHAADAHVVDEFHLCCLRLRDRLDREADDRRRATAGRAAPLRPSGAYRPPCPAPASRRSRRPGPRECRVRPRHRAQLAPLDDPRAESDTAVAHLGHNLCLRPEATASKPTTRQCQKRSRARSSPSVPVLKTPNHWMTVHLGAATSVYSIRWPARQPISQKLVSSRVASLKIGISSASRAGVA